MASKRSKDYVALLAQFASEYRNAPVIEVNETYRDVFERMHDVVSAELCHGVWRTFRSGSNCMPSSHESREAAKVHALRMLGVTA